MVEKERHYRKFESCWKGRKVRRSLNSLVNDGLWKKTEYHTTMARAKTSVQGGVKLSRLFYIYFYLFRRARWSYFFNDEGFFKWKNVSWVTGRRDHLQPDQVVSLLWLVNLHKTSVFIERLSWDNSQYSVNSKYSVKVVREEPQPRNIFRRFSWIIWAERFLDWVFCCC